MSDEIPARRLLSIAGVAAVLVAVFGLIFWLLGNAYPVKILVSGAALYSAVVAVTFALGGVIWAITKFTR